MTKACVIVRKDKSLVLREHKSVFRISNQKQRAVTCHEVDGCLVSAGLRCDWLLVDDATGHEIFVELKGCDIEHALAQLCASVDSLSKGKAARKKGYIICTRSPLSSPMIQKLQKKVLATHNLILRVRKTVHEETIEQVIA